MILRLLGRAWRPNISSVLSPKAQVKGALAQKRAKTLPRE